QELIQQANARLEEAYQQQQALADQLNTKAQPQAQTIAPTKPAAATYAVSSDQAALIALTAAPGAKLTRGPELVKFQGIVAYEVMLDRGTVYVDATTGQVLYNGATVVPAAPAGQQIANGGGGGASNGGAHEGGEGEHEGGGSGGGGESEGGG
ncbi:MAG: PepSY domain-containing protein, partial [Chloroflexi bacterium]|nr:PepSY domain-containing protein [Chloroflexota bacterium]